MRLKLLSLVFPLLFLGCAPYASSGYVRVAPPEPIIEMRGAAPGIDFIWIDGYYSWNGVTYIWYPGRWYHRPYPYSIWIGGGWQHHNRGWRYHPGHWRH